MMLDHTTLFQTHR
ncbi:MAG: hypothetical protein KDE28_24430, partial [Anaerolineales bacterium]|nr:hypothetical protein [Anaerolineales bacterium]